MKCPHCGMEIKAKEKTCPYCYGIIECSDHDDCESGDRGKVKKILVICALLAVIISAAALAFFFLLPSDSANPDAVTARYGEHELSNREFNYYFWNDYYYFQSNYGFAPTDLKSLSREKYDDTTTWQDYFTDSALTNWRDITVVCAAADEAGFELPENYQSSLDTLHDDLLSTAEGQGFDTVDEYLKHHYGPEADFDSYKAFLTNNYYANAYADEIYSGYYDEYAQDVAEPSINVRHILIKYEDRDTPEEAKAEAERIYELFKADPSEDHFAALANEHSTDGGSNTQGGLYSNVCKGDMVEEFDAWCFDPARQVGDNGIVETQFGYHIMYFCGQGSEMTSVDDSAALDMYYSWLSSLTDGEAVPEDEAMEIYYPTVD